jgi:hypothetical protein
MDLETRKAAFARLYEHMQDNDEARILEVHMDSEATRCILSIGEDIVVFEVVNVVETMTVAEYAHKVGLTPSAVHYRIKHHQVDAFWGRSNNRAAWRIPVREDGHEDE